MRHMSQSYSDIRILAPPKGLRMKKHQAISGAGCHTYRPTRSDAELRARIVRAWPPGPERRQWLRWTFPRTLKTSKKKTP